MGWIHLGPDTGSWWAVLNIMSPMVPENAGNILSSRGCTSFSRKAHSWGSLFYHLMLCMRVNEKNLQVLLFEMPTCRNFNCCWYVWQRALVFMLMWYEAYAQKEHGCGSPTPWSTLENWSHFEVWGVRCLLGTKSVRGCCLLTACGSAWQRCDVRQHIAKWCHM